MKNKKIFLGSLLLLLIGLFASCNEDQTTFVEFDPTMPIKVTGFYPDSGGIAQPIIIEGENFGSDTTGMKVYFQDTLGMKHEAGLVSSNGKKIYAFVPKLTFLRAMKLVVERKLDNNKTVSGIGSEIFLYKTQTTVTTVVGKPDYDNNSVPTVGGSFTSATLSSPFTICLDDENNIFISERGTEGQQPRAGLGQGAWTDKGVGVNGNILMADTKNEELVVIKYEAGAMNAPAFSTEAGNEAVYLPEDGGLYFYSMHKSLNYTPRRRSLITDETTKDIINDNWKYSFVVNTNDHMVYTVMWKGQLVRFNPSTRVVELLLNQVTPDLVNAKGQNGSNCYLTFSSTEPDMLYISQEDYNLISRVNIATLDTVSDPTTFKGEMYAGRAITEGPITGSGWEDGLLQNAKFFAPRQICFTADGKLYIADSQNHCIRVVDTTVPADKATVNTAIGLPGNRGFRDGGPEIAMFNYPTGVAVNADGSEVFVADKRNHVIRKLSIQ